MAGTYQVYDIYLTMMENGTDEKGLLASAGGVVKIVHSNTAALLAILFFFLNLYFVLAPTEYTACLDRKILCWFGNINIEREKKEWKEKKTRTHIEK